MNQKTLSELCKQKDQVLFIRFTSLKKIVCTLPTDINLIRSQSKEKKEKIYPVKFEEESIKFKTWCNEKWTTIRASYNDIGYYVIYKLPILLSIHTLEEWNNSQDMIFDDIYEFSQELNKL